MYTPVTHYVFACHSLCIHLSFTMCLPATLQVHCPRLDRMAAEAHDSYDKGVSRSQPQVLPPSLLPSLHLSQLFLLLFLLFLLSFVAVPLVFILILPNSTAKYESSQMLLRDVPVLPTARPRPLPRIVCRLLARAERGKPGVACKSAAGLSSLVLPLLLFLLLNVSLLPLLLLLLLLLFFVFVFLLLIG